MQIDKTKVTWIKEKLKQQYSSGYALPIVIQLRLSGLKVTPQQVYNFFNRGYAVRQKEIINTAMQLINEEGIRLGNSNKKAA
jgi:hypothetical protein